MSFTKVDILGDRMPYNKTQLLYTQRPVVSTSVSRAAQLEAPGQNLVVCVALDNGFNIEDAIVLNRAAVERGLLTAQRNISLMPLEVGDKICSRHGARVRVCACARVRVCVCDIVLCVLRAKEHRRLDAKCGRPPLQPRRYCPRRNHESACVSKVSRFLCC